MFLEAYTNILYTRENSIRFRAAYYLSVLVSAGPEREYDTSSVSVGTGRHVPLLIKSPRQWKRESPGS